MDKGAPQESSRARVTAVPAGTFWNVFSFTFLNPDVKTSISRSEAPE